MSLAVIGVDPGVRGGVSVLGDSGVPLYVRGFQPEMTEDELGEALRQALGVARAFDRRVVYMEKVGYIRGDGAQGAFTFGQVNGIIRGFLIAHGVTRRYVMPTAWQSRLDCLTRGDKNVTKRLAAKLFPTVKVVHAVADSLLIAHYGRLCEAAR